MSVFKIRDVEHGKAKLFFDESGTVDIQRYETSKYPIFAKLLEQQQSFFWRPSEINLSKDSIDFKQFSKAQEHVFTSNLKRQILLDSVQGRAPSVAYGPIVSDPTLETLIHCWTFFEGIHSQSYTHILRNVYPNPSKVFDEMREIREIVECGDSVSVFYDELIERQNKLEWGHYETKRALYRSLLATNALEQIRFQVSFACTFAFGQQDLMVGSSKIIGLIKNDESLHCGITQNLLKYLPQDDEDFIRIAEEELFTAKEIYLDVHKQEKEWVDFLFQEGPIFGLTAEEVKLYLDWLVDNRMSHFGLKHDIAVPKKKPLPWLRRWEDGKSDQVAPQESEIISYQVGNVDMNIDKSAIDFDF